MDPHLQPYHQGQGHLISLCWSGEGGNEQEMCLERCTNNYGRGHFVETRSFAPLCLGPLGPWAPVCLLTGGDEWVQAQSLSALDTRPREVKLEPSALLPSGQTHKPSLGALEPARSFLLIPLLPSSCARECTIWVRKQGGNGSGKGSCVFFEEARAWGSHLPTSSYDCHGQSDAKAHSPQEQLLGPA